jgi:hypothetical protein
MNHAQQHAHVDIGKMMTQMNAQNVTILVNVALDPEMTNVPNVTMVLIGTMENV